MATLLPPESLLLTAISHASDLGLIFGPLVGYYFQYDIIVKTKNSEGFSKAISFILFISNISRIFFWFGKQYHTTLLIQSILMVAMQFVLLEACIRFDSTSPKKPAVQDLQSLFKKEEFWQWPDLLSYIIVIMVMVFGFSFVTYTMVDYPQYVELLGFFSVFSEAFLGIPQFLKNNKNKSTEGLSMGMIGCWLFGDAFKTVYYLCKDQPSQFIIGGLIQLTLDILIVSQFYVYKGNKAQHPETVKLTHFA
mmetsp:Transcript_28906/g.33060  ORF Transcript_28906/g.33060 Transcript_28906/m.33060 type:complete len:250 (-) Transcript_28906:700-1449(-)